jgi:ABC-2 type transport system ATP-binding protein
MSQASSSGATSGGSISELPEQGTKPAGEAVVTLQRVSKVFKDFWMRDRARAVDSISLEIRPREVFGLLGPNGSGKSTTIKMILGLLKPTAGRISVFGKLPTDVATKRRIGYLPEESYLYGFLNARETLDYYGKLFELDSATRRRRIDELLDMIGLTNAQFRPVREYSKGMQRRIGIAQALINDPDLLILDEPTTGLDPIGTRQIKDLIIELGRRGKTILLSSHLLADVEDCVDRMVILYGGVIRAQGTCDDLLTRQATMSIETDPLDDATLSKIDEIIRIRSDGQKAVQRVSKPRQKLEELFLEIVEKARSEQINTSGATAGGVTASFLKASEGDQLIEDLVRTQPIQSEPAEVTTPAAPVATAAAQAASVIDSLLTPEPAPTPAAPSTPSRGKPTPVAPADDIDDSVIGNLLGGPKKPGDPENQR